jgi:plasmid stabilization system protein ParE
MPEIVWKQGAENDLFHIFADLEDRSEGSGERFVQKLPNSLLIPVASLCFPA